MKPQHPELTRAQFEKRESDRQLTQGRTRLALDRALIDVLNVQRDELAKVAMAQFIALKEPGAGIGEIAVVAYMQADAMLVAKYKTLEVRK
jgi:hypothetical protein